MSGLHDGPPPAASQRAGVTNSKFNVTRTGQWSSRGASGTTLSGSEPDGSNSSSVTAVSPVVGAAAESPPTPPAVGGPPGTPPLAPRATPVPLITPRYQKKSRTNRRMELTDSFTERGTASDLLRQHATESLTVTNGPQTYQQEMHFHAYDVYRHGKRAVHTRSVGYSSDGDIVMTREDYSETSDVDNTATRVHTVISSPTVLDPAARRPLTDTELNSKHKLNLRRPRYKKYPGVRAPRNKKLRNRLMNDFFANEQAMAILSLARERRDAGIDDQSPPLRPSFHDLPPSVLAAFDLPGDEQEAELARLGVTETVKMNHTQQPCDPDAADTRFFALNLRLRGELLHAINSSDFLSQQIEDLEVLFSRFIHRGPTRESLVFCFRDGYGRLVCHGVAAYYQLVSESVAAADGGTKLTRVSFPRTRRSGVRDVHLPSAPLLYVLQKNRGNVPAQHPLSATNTPQQAPERAPPEMDGGEELPMSPLDLNANAKAFGMVAPAPVASLGCNRAAADAATDGGGDGGGPRAPAPSHGVLDENGSNVDVAPTREAPTVSVSSASSLSPADSDVKDQAGATASVVAPAYMNPTVFLTQEEKLTVTEVPTYAPCLLFKSLSSYSP